MMKGRQGKWIHFLMRPNCYQAKHQIPQLKKKNCDDYKKIEDMVYMAEKWQCIPY